MRSALKLSGTVLLLAVLLTLGLAGCRIASQLASQMATQLRVFVAVGDDRDSDEERSLNALKQQVVEEYLANNPDIRLQVRFLPEKELKRQVLRQSAVGAGPDLVISRVIPAAQLYKDGLVSAASLDTSDVAELNLRELEQFRSGVGYPVLPFLFEPSLACFNRKRVKNPPRQLSDLQKLAASGIRVALPIEVDELIWTAQSFGQRNDLILLISGGKWGKGQASLEEQNRAGKLAWLQWLANLNLEQNVSFAATLENLLPRLEDGSVDWISCNSTAVPRLRAKMGDQLGLSLLPASNDGRPAGALTRMLVISFGRDSTAKEREQAERFAMFLLNDYSQSKIMLRAIGNLPANQDVPVPRKEMPDLGVMEDSLSTAFVLPFSTSERIPTQARERVNTLLKRNIYQEWTPSRTLQGLEEVFAPPQQSTMRRFQP
jgi:ABC-type glycerol-3-phosphate transport system substrate-binding protein